MTWFQFWLLTAAIYDAAYRLKNGGKHFIVTIFICLLMAFICFVKGIVGL